MEDEWELVGEKTIETTVEEGIVKTEKKRELSPAFILLVGIAVAVGVYLIARSRVEAR